jgi:hypothetical protein
MSTVTLEVIRLSMHGESLFVATSYEQLPDNTDPIVYVSQSAPLALTHSTSWRWADDGLILTFVQVYEDGQEVPLHLATRGIEYHDVTSLPDVECHAVRHLYFLLHTDNQVAAVDNLATFWTFARHVADYHHPAVAGLLPAK